MKEILKLALLLTLISAICAALLSGVFNGTAESRASVEMKKKLDAASKVLPGGCPEPIEIVVGGQTNLASYAADGKLIATAVEATSPNGYGGDIRIIVGISAAEEKVIDFIVLSSQETPGLGKNISSQKFRGGICGKPLSTNFAVKKDGGEIDAVTSATISSRALLEAIRSAIEIHRQIPTVNPGAIKLLSSETETEAEAEANAKTDAETKDQG